MCEDIKKSEKSSYAAFLSRHNVPLEIALDLTGFGKFNYVLLAICCLSLLAMGMEMFGMSFVMTAATCDLKLTMAQKGLLSAMPMIGIIFMSYPWGYIQDTRGRRRTLMVSMSCGFFFSFISSFAPNMVVLSILKLLSVTFLSAANSSVYTLIGEFQPKQYRDKMLLFTTTGMMFISGINGLLAFPVLTMMDFSIPIAFLDIAYRPWRLLIVVYGLPSGLSAILLFWLSESPKFLLSQGRTEKALQVLRRVYVINTGDFEYNYPVDSILFEEKSSIDSTDTILQSMWKQCAPIIKKPLVKQSLILYFLIFNVYFVSNAFSLWMPSISNKFLNGMNRQSSNDRNFCSVIVSTPDSLGVLGIKGSKTPCNDKIEPETFWIIIVLSGINCLLHFVSIGFVNYYGKKIFVIGILVVTGTFGLLTNITSDPIAGLAFFIIFTLESLATGAITAFAVEIYPTYVRGMSLCMLIMVSRCGAIVGTSLVGLFLESHCESSFYVYSLLIMSCGFVAMFLPNDSRRKHKTFLLEVTHL